MALDDILETLAFGKSTPKVAACLGLYLSPEVIYLSETHVDGKGKLVIDHLVRIPVPAAEAKDKDKKTGGAGTASTLNTDFLTDNMKLSALIRQSMSQLKWNTKDVMVTLSHHLGLLRYFAMPAVERRFLRSALPLEAKKYIPIPFEVLSHDYQIVPLPPDAAGKARQGALIAVTQSKNLSNIQALMESLGLNLVGMEVAPCSVLRLWECLEKQAQSKTHCQVHFDGGNIRILLADKGLPVFFRELFLGADVSLADIRKVDLGGCVGFAQKQLGVGALAQIRVSGSVQGLPAWQDAFTQEMGIAATVQDTPGLLGIKGGDWGGYAAIGSSIRFILPSASTLDLGKVGKTTDEERDTARDMFYLGGAIAIWFAVLGLFRELNYAYHARDFAKFKRDPTLEAVFVGKTNQDIVNLLQTMQGQINHVAGLSGGTKTTEIIKDLVDSLPDKVWITRAQLHTPVVQGREAVSLELSGRAVAGSLSQEQDLAFEFRDRLVKSPVIGKMFKEIQVSVTANPIPADLTKGLDPISLMKKLEERTSFIVFARQGSR